MDKNNAHREPMPGCSEAEWRVRVNLAACYRLIHHYGMDKVIWNHITARVPGSHDTFLINRLGLRYDEICASNLIKVDIEGNALDTYGHELNRAGFIIHSAIHQARPEIECVIHTHTRAGIAVSALSDGFIPMCQEAMIFYEKIGYHEYEGVSEDFDERTRLIKDLGSNLALVLRNHGLVTVGKSIAEAFWLMFNLDLACKAQVDVLSSGASYRLPPAELCRKVSQQHWRRGTSGEKEWPALLRLLDKLCPEYCQRPIAPPAGGCHDG